MLLEAAADRNAWALAYAEQSKSDFEIYRLLSGMRAVEPCHSPTST